MGTWLVSRTGLQDFYQQLQQVALFVRDGEGYVPASVVSADSPDAYLSGDDIALWLKRRSARERNGLYFVEEGESGTETHHSSLAELSMLYSQLIMWDFTDGRFDGHIQSLPASIDVPFDVDDMAALVPVYRNAIFEIDVTMRSEDSGSATAWIREKEKIGEGQWRYYLITNAHVVDSHDREKIDFRVKSASGETYRAEVVGADHIHDVGVLTFVANEEFPALPISLSLPAIGEKIAEVGNQESLGVAYTPGTVNAAPDFSFDNSLPTIRYDCNGSRGNSGSPVFNARGEVIGIDFMGKPNDMGASIGFAVPMSLVEESYRQLRVFGRYEDGGWMEARYQVLSAHELSILGIGAPVGYYVRHVDIGSRAERAGLKAGHILVAAEGAHLPDDWQRFEYEISRRSAGSEIEFDVVTIEEPDKKVTLKYAIDWRSDPIRSNWETPFGFTVVDLDRGTLEELEQTDGIVASRKARGVLVKIPSSGGGRSETGSSIPFVGIPDGAVIESVGGSPVNSVAEFRRAIQMAMTSQNAPIAMEIVATRRSGPYAGLRSIYLINGVEKRKQEQNEELGIRYIELDGAEKETLGVASDLQAFYVSRVKDRVIGLGQEQLFEGDVIVGYNGQPLAGRREDEGFPIIEPLLKAIGVNFPMRLSRTMTFSEFIGHAEKGTEYSLQAVRNGRLIDVKRIAGGLSYPKPLTGREWAGSDCILAEPLTVEQKKRLHVDEKISGVYITVRTPDGAPPEHPYRLECGMIVVSVNGKQVTCSDDFYKALAEAAIQSQPIVFEIAGSVQWKYPGYRDYRIVDLF